MDSGSYSGARIGVLTFHRSLNYGSYWQARCLSDWVRRNYREALIIDHDSRRTSFAELRCAFRPHLPASTRRHDIPLYHEKVRLLLNSFSALPMSPPFSLDDSA